jgi:hypothetical protein
MGEVYPCRSPDRQLLAVKSIRCELGLTVSEWQRGNGVEEYLRLAGCATPRVR